MWPSFIIFLLMTVLFYALSRWLPHINDSEAGIRTTGEITKSIQEDGLTLFYIRFTDNGVDRQGTTGYYSDTKSKYFVGAPVEIEYTQDSRIGNYHIRILDDDLVAAGAQSVPRAARVCTILSIICGVFSLYCLIRSIILR